MKSGDFQCGLFYGTLSQIIWVVQFVDLSFLSLSLSLSGFTEALDIISSVATHVNETIRQMVSVIVLALLNSYVIC